MALHSCFHPASLTPHSAPLHMKTFYIYSSRNSTFGFAFLRRVWAKDSMFIKQKFQQVILWTLSLSPQLLTVQFTKCISCFALAVSQPSYSYSSGGGGLYCLYRPESLAGRRLYRYPTPMHQHPSTRLPSPKQSV